MIKHGRDVIGMALKALGYSQNSEDVDALAQAQPVWPGEGVGAQVEGKAASAGRAV